MKKLIYCAAALATALFAGSCQQELLDTPAGETTFTYSVEIPEAMTKAIGDGTNVNNLFYEVWITKTENDQTLDGAVRLYHKNIEMVRESGKTSRANVTLNLVQNQFYTILFWAQCGNAGQGVYDVTNLTEVTYKENVEYKSNKEMYAAFYAVDYASDKTPRSKKVLLKRPFAQINLGTTNDVPADEYRVNMTASSVTVKNVPTTFNVATSAVSEVVDEFTFALSEDLPTEPLVAGGKTYDYAAMNYIFAGGNIELDYTINTMLTPTAQGSNPTPATITRTIPNVPVKENYRTNIVGSLLTNHSTYEVIVDASWNDFEGGNMVQLGDGIVVNLNGDYEISNENGLAYAMNNLFKENGTYYLTKDLYDMAGFEVTPPSVPAGVVINIYGETPVVTRSTTTVAGVEIIGLESAFIGEVESDAKLSISGVAMTDSGSVLVNDNKGTVIVSETTADKVVATGNLPVDADKVETLDALQKSLASGVKTIEITGNLNNVTEAILVDRSVVINGNNKTFTTSASRAFRLTTSDIEVTFNNLDIVSTAVRIYPNDVRGVAIDSDLSNVVLTLNNCTIDFTDKTANDWSYAVNVAGNGTGHKVTVNGGTYEGANVVNAHGAKNTITVKNATLTSMYPANEVYYGACIWVLQNQESSVYAEGNTFNGSNAIAFNLGTGTALEEKDNTDNTKLYLYKAGSNLYHTLTDAIAAIDSEGEVKVLHNAKVDAVTVPNGKTITLNLNDKTIEGVDNATVSYAVITNKGNLTVVGPGAMKLTATNNRGWNAYSSVISNTVGGNLTVKGGAVIEHLGGTDMAYGIDNLTNGKGTSAITTIEDATVKSPYRAIRQFLNGVEATNELYVKAGAHIESVAKEDGSRNKSIWMQDPSANANTGKLVVEEGAKLYGDVYLFVCAGSESWPVSASIPASTLMDGSEVMTGNVPEGYTVENVGGVWKVIAWTSVSTADELVAALEAKQSVVFANDIQIDPAKMSNAYGTTGINIKNGQSINGNGKTLNIQGAGGTWDSGINTTGGLIKNLTVTGSFRGIFINHNSTYSEKVVLENVTIGGNGTVYTISCDQGLYQGIEATNCTFNGWTSFAKTAGEAKFVNCSFGEGSGYKYCRPYSNTEFVNCTFCPGYAVDTTRATVTFTDCTWEE